MIEIPASRIPPPLRAFFKVAAVPAGLRFGALLAGDIAGTAWTDDPEHPTWGILQEAAYGTLHLEGHFPNGLLAAFIKERRLYGDVLYGFREDGDALAGQLPPTQYDGRVWESDQRQSWVDLESIIAQTPTGCQLRALDAHLFRRTRDFLFYADMFGSPERALSKIFGCCLMRGDELLCEAFAGVSHNGLIEIGVSTSADQRQNRYARVACAAVIREAERRGLRTYWNCAVQNTASAALAHRLGYAPMRQYRLLGWFPV